MRITALISASVAALALCAVSDELENAGGGSPATDPDPQPPEPEAREVPKMRAKLRLGSVTPSGVDSDGKAAQELLQFHGVAKSGSYPADGSDEDNTFAKFSPSVSLNLTLANPALIGKYQPGDTFYLDFTPVE